MQSHIAELASMQRLFLSKGEKGSISIRMK